MTAAARADAVSDLRDSHASNMFWIFDVRLCRGLSKFGAMVLPWILMKFVVVSYKSCFGILNKLKSRLGSGVRVIVAG